MLPDESRPEEDDDNIYFVSTQMQSKHDETVLREKEQTAKKRTISKLLGFKNELKELELKVSEPKPKKARTVKKAQNKSMSALVRDKFEKKELLPYFSGDQTKIDDFMSRVRRMEDLEKLPNSSLALYSPSEWNRILQCIKLKFPTLTPLPRQNLKVITKKINEFELQNTGGVWNEASAQPEIGSEELKWLYDLSDEQMKNTMSFNEEFNISNDQYVMTLSQTTPDDLRVEEVLPLKIFDLPTTKSGSLNPSNFISGTSDVIVILDSELEPEELDVHFPSRQIDFDPLISIQSLPFKAVKPKEQSNRKPPIFEVISSLPLKQSQVAEDKTSDGNSSKLFKEFFVSSSEFPGNARVDNPNLQSLEIISPPKDDQKSLELNKENVLSSLIMPSNEDPLSPMEKISDIPSLPINSTILSDEEITSSKSTPTKNKVTENIPSPSPYRQVPSSLKNSPLTSPTKIDSPFRAPKQTPLTNNELSPFKTPTKKSKRLLDEIVSPLISRGELADMKATGSPVKSPMSSPITAVRMYSAISNSSPIQSPLKSNLRGDVLTTPIRLIKNSSNIQEEEMIMSTAESVYSTARSQPYETRRILNMSRYEVSHINVKDMYDADTKIGVRSLGTKVIELDLDNEIADSEDENEVSIIEIVRVEEEESTLQVPHSPNKVQVPSSLNNLPDSPPTKLQLTEYSTKELKSKIAEWGLKPVKSRAKMVQVLTETSKLIIESSQITQEVLLLQSQTSEYVQNNINSRIGDLIKNDEYWYEKVISYEPIRPQDLQDWLSSIGYEIELDTVKKYCDATGITTRQ